VTSTSEPAAVPANSKQTVKRRFPAWLAYSLLTLLLWGVWGVTSKVISDDIDAYTNQVFFAVGLLPLVVIFLFSPRIKGGINRTRGISYAFITGILGGSGNILFFKSLMVGGKASIVVPVTGLSPIVTVLLAYFALNERLTGLQKIGFVLALIAIYLLST
jgi:bacterial/archaeal transporter family protein